MLDLKKNNISTTLTALRKSHKLTQKEVATIMNISSQAVSKWERGDSIPDIKQLISISNYYKVSIDTIITGKIANKSNSILHKNALLTVGLFLLLISFISYKNVFFLSEGKNIVVMYASLSTGIFTLLIDAITIKPYDIYTPRNRLLFAGTLSTYVIINYVFDIWSISWIILLISYNIGGIKK